MVIVAPAEWRSIPYRSSRAGQSRPTDRETSIHNRVGGSSCPVAHSVPALHFLMRCRRRLWWSCIPVIVILTTIATIAGTTNKFNIESKEERGFTQ